MDSSLFDRSKIYERLEIIPRPLHYDGKLPWAVQQTIAATNGIHFVNSIGALTDYPIPPIPVKPSAGKELFLDIGCGWGRWLVAAGKKNYLPVGIDLRLEFCELSRFVMRDNGIQGYAVVADLKNLPFQENTFDVIWSFSVIQHTHYDRMLGCIECIRKSLKNEKGFCFLEFPNRNGIHNRFGPAKKYAESVKEYNSWDVRYYTPGQYRSIFKKYFNNFKYFNHSALGIGVLPGDAKYANGLKNKLGILLSRSLSNVFEIVTPLKFFSDSIYIQCYKREHESDLQDAAVKCFWESHRTNPENNLNIMSILRCPASGGKLVLSENGHEIISVAGKLAYPVKNGIPIMIPGEARSL